MPEYFGGQVLGPHTPSQAGLILTGFPLSNVPWLCYTATLPCSSITLCYFIIQIQLCPKWVSWSGVKELCPKWVSWSGVKSWKVRSAMLPSKPLWHPAVPLQVPAAEEGEAQAAPCSSSRAPGLFGPLVRQQVHGTGCKQPLCHPAWALTMWNSRFFSTLESSGDPYSSLFHVLTPDKIALIQINQYNNLTCQNRQHNHPFENFHAEADKRRAVSCSGSN